LSTSRALLPGGCAHGHASRSLRAVARNSPPLLSDRIGCFASWQRRRSQGDSEQSHTHLIYRCAGGLNGKVSDPMALEPRSKTMNRKRPT